MTASLLRRALLIVVGLAATLAVLIVLLLPPRTLPATAPAFRLTWPAARGAFHVHSVRSDGTGTLDEIAAAAARAGLQFVIMTDHGNGTRPPEPPRYRAGVLFIDGVEISTRTGHYVAIDLPRTPYPLAGESGDVIDDVRRFGGFGVAAHPGSPKDELRWSDWSARFDAVEWLNADSEWRDEFLGSLGRGLLTYAFRPVETLGSLLDRPHDVLQQWERQLTTRRVPALAGADAHERLGFRQSADPYQDRVLARLPSYEVSFRSFANHVILNGSLTGDAAADAALLTSAIREGRVFTSLDSLAGLTAFEAKALSGNRVARLGEYLTIDGPVAIEASIAAPPGTTLSVLRDGTSIYEATAPAVRVDVGREPGAYRIEAHLTGRVVPWVLSNPIYVGLFDRHLAASRIDPPSPPAERSPIATASWQSEASPGSSSRLQPIALEDGTPALGWEFALAGGEKAEQYAAMRFDVDPRLATHDRLLLRALSDVPRRIWAQLRAPGSRHGERWGKTFYLDNSLTEVTLRFDEFRPLEPASSSHPPLDRIDSLLLVVDTLNNEPGTSGRLAITDLWLAK